ncbi:MAG: serine/threonine-protein kinase [Deltaproteobacteria bacterium]
MADGLIGTSAGNYRILDKISDGGMGSVYRAEHTLIGRLVAVKVLLPELTGNREIVDRFFREAKATTAIKHPGIVEVFDFGYLETGLAYIVMELLEGMTLARRIKMRGPMPEGEAAALLRGVCSGLAAAHDKGIVHRDLKPDNLFLVQDLDIPNGERIKLLDFGIAKLTDIGSAHAATKTGAVMGTPTYMSPEQCRGSGDVDARADIYSLGCIFYQLLTGKPPFANEGAGEVIGMHLYVQPEPPSRHALGISPDTEALVMAMLAKDPKLRPQSARELAQAFGAVAHAHGWNTSSGAAWSADGSQSFAPQSYTPSYLPPQPTPRPPTASPSQPTTLSGAASQSVAAPPRSKKGPILAVVAALAIVGGGVAFSVAKGSDKPAAPAAAVQPAPAPAPPPPPLVEVKPVEKPAVVEVPPPVEAKPEIKPEVKAPAIAKKKPEKKLEKKPVEKKPKDSDSGDLPVETGI